MKKTNLGILLGLASYVAWGFLPFFWKSLAGVSAYNTFSYRILFTIATMLAYMLISRSQQRYHSELTALVKNKKQLSNMLLASALIALNWLTYIYAVGHEQASQASLGYYIVPLLSVVLSVLFLREKLTKWLLTALLIASCGVIILIKQAVSFPIVAFLIAISFAWYGLVKKRVSLSSDVAMLVEALVISPIALGYLCFFNQESFFNYTLSEMICLFLSGLATAVPLLLFAESLKRAPLSIIGFIQYINPTLQLVIALLFFKETMSKGEWLGILCIWVAIGIFVLGQVSYLLATDQKKSGG